MTVQDTPDAAAPETATTGLPVRWGLAAATGSRLVPPGPAVSAAEAAAEVARLADGARVGEGHVRELTGLGVDLPIPEAAVVDRPGWISSATEGIAELTSEVRLPTVRSGSPSALTRAAGEVTSTVAAAQMGGLLSFLATKVLGQYDPFAGPEHAGRLLLVAPNIMAAREALDVDADDFALWVCVHEATHRLQFTAVPWLREHFRDEVTSFASGMESGVTAALERLPDIAKALRSRTDVSLLELLQGPEQTEILDRLLALTTLLEGHAEHVMDEVGPAVVPSVEVIRRRFTARRRGGGPVDRLLRVLLGVQAKIQQYEQGRVFVDDVVGKIGMDGFNAVWTSPDTLPRRAEITDPSAWVKRVHG
ncbi:zinc-dependent metalloprotease [Actinomycetospora endophytica]|uniref:Zinc-dependent metalloprotease n=1 Tax=Actinomycetospora endophytica TaxID=2291215 RepID=A0ABS8P6Y7_9PSEU|nr:zinc-dependent metalloprotease [Actinomycetospora endophytica]MCD2194022.1 zinc-dependent metalloprotease [Actinomycetospora endophytica]